MAPANAAGIALFCNGTAHGEEKETRFLLLLNKWGDREWGFPKGHIDKADGKAAQAHVVTTGESFIDRAAPHTRTHIITALRETREETGFTADRIRLHTNFEDRADELTRVEYAMKKPSKKIPDGVKRVALFLGEIQPEADGDYPAARLSKEHLRATWFTLPEVTRILRTQFLLATGLTQTTLERAGIYFSPHEK